MILPFKLNYQSIQRAGQKTDCELAMRTCCAVELLYKLTAAHIGGHISVYVGAAMLARSPAGREYAL